MNDHGSAATHPTNRLSGQTSPYLLQHAGNPVDWYPWGEAAFARARAEDRPLLLSVGYSACHWCHVMAHESFENEEIAARMNADFVNVKVDREERPDVDEIYMAAVQAMTGSGGWPLTVFLTPDLRPFFGGTYFPPEDRQGRPGLPRVLETVARHYASRRDRVEDQAARLREFLAEHADPLGAAPAAAGGDLGAEAGEAILRTAARAFIDSHDAHHGGFSPSGPKFPNAAGLALLLRHWHDEGDEAALEAACHTLRRMACGGIYDQLGGGFHRYCVDAAWRVPHFEKMLYDNALLVPVYVDAWQATGQTLFAEVVQGTLDYLVREMQTPEGGYTAAQDADSEGREGRFFLWTPQQVQAAVGDAETARLVGTWYGITPEGGFEDGTSIPHVGDACQVQARRLGVTATRLRAALEQGRQRLLAARSARPAPARDDKVLAAWNGLAITAMCRGAQALGPSTWLDSAVAAGRFCLEHLAGDGDLGHSWKDGRISVSAFQDDYAALVAGLVDLYETTLDPSWLRPARDLARGMIERFWDPERGAFYYTEPGRQDLLVRTKNPFDGATPSGNSLAAMALLRLGALTGESRFEVCARGTLAAYADLLRRAPAACPAMACALHQYVRGPLEITVVGPAELRAPLLREAWSTYLPHRVIAGAGGAADAITLGLLPLLAGRGPGTAAARAYVCRNATCAPPVETAPQLRALLAAVQGGGGS